MKIYVGSLNPAKVEAVREALSDYPLFANCEVVGFEASSGVSEQPKSLDETMRGAITRAKHAWQEGGVGFGLESGLMQVPHTETGHMDVCVCAIWDGQKHVTGISSAWECPPEITKMMIEDGMDMQEAFYRSGRTDDPKIGSSIGAIGLLTEGRIDRKAYTKQAIHMAMIHLKKP
ncbi:MAG: inosine/xanthosine triphosphatase [Patescibacteria group bacterium]|jgi:inosine/xanthosine triphosphatase